MSVSPPNPAVIQFLTEASCRHIPSFFLGGLFLSALTSMVSPSFLSHFLARCRGHPADADPEGLSEKSRSLDTNSTSSSVLKRENRTLFFLLSFFLASASIAHFASLPTFPIDANIACAFVVAWGGIATRAACLIGLLILFLELRSLGIQRWEIILYFGWLVLATASVFVTNALGTGKLIPSGIAAFANVAFCVRNRIFAASVVSSLVYILLECYTLFRLWSLLAPPFLSTRHKLSTITDARILRAASLLTLELLVIYPSAVPTNVLIEFLPFSLGALLVLAAFSMPVKAQRNHRINSIPPSSRFTSMRLSSGRQSVPASQNQWRGSGLSAHDSTSLHGDDFGVLPALHHHPFSARSLSDPTMQSRDWPAPTRTARSSRTIDTAAARSIRNAIVQSARRAVGASGRESTSMAPSSPTTIPITASSPSFFESQAIVTTLPSPALARPRLMLVTSSNELNGGEEPPDSSVLRPVMHGSSVVRLTPTFVSPHSLQYPISPLNPVSYQTPSFKLLPQPPDDVSPPDSMGSLPTSSDEQSFGKEGVRRESSYTFGQHRFSAAHTGPWPNSDISSIGSTQ